MAVRKVKTIMSEVSETSNPSGGVDNSVGSNPLEISNAMITTVKLDGTNYLSWSQSALLYISDKGKEEYILEDLTIPSTMYTKYLKWKTDKVTVMS